MGAVDEKQDISLLWHNRQLINTVQSFSYTAKVTWFYQYTPSIAIPVSSSGTIRKGRGTYIPKTMAMQLLANYTYARPQLATHSAQILFPMRGLSIDAGRQDRLRYLKQRKICMFLPFERSTVGII